MQTQLVNDESTTLNEHSFDDAETQEQGFKPIEVGPVVEGRRESGRRSLFEITAEMSHFQDILFESGGDITNPQVEAEVMKIIELYELDKVAFYEKVRGWCAVIKENAYRENFHKEQAAKHERKAKKWGNTNKTMKATLCTELTKLGIASLDLGEFKITIRNSGGKEPVELAPKAVDGLSRTELRKFAQPTYRIVVDSVRDYLQSGKKLKWATLAERKKSIIID